MTFEDMVDRLVELGGLPAKQRRLALQALGEDVSSEEGRLVMQAGLQALLLSKGVTVEEPRAMSDLMQLSLNGIVKDIASYVRKYVSMDEVMQLLVVYYSVMTWFVPYLGAVPYLYIRSRGPGCGKTQLGYVMRNLCCRSVLTESISVVALAQLYELHQGLTLVLDEVDNWKQTDRAEIFSLFKASVRPGAGRIVLRQDGRSKTSVPVQQDCFGPKIFIGIQKESTFDAALLSRCLIVELQELQGVMPYVAPFADDEEAARIRCACATLSKNYGLSKTCARQVDLRQGLESLTPRQFDTIEPLLILASIVDAERGLRQGGDVDALRAYALGVMSHGADDSYEKQLLVEIRSAIEVFQNGIRDLSKDARLYGYVALEPCRLVSRPPQWKTPQDERDVVTKFSLIRGLGGELGIHQVELYAQVLRQEDSVLYRPPESFRQKTTAQGVLKPGAFAEIIRKYVRSKSSGAVRYVSLDDLDQVLLKQTGKGICCLTSLKQRFHR